MKNSIVNKRCICDMNRLKRTFFFELHHGRNIPQYRHGTIKNINNSTSNNGVMLVGVKFDGSDDVENLSTEHLIICRHLILEKA